MNIRDLIVQTAKSYIGMKEVGKNAGFENAIFEEKMKGVGFDSGEAWCSLFAELVVCEAYGKLDSTYIYKLQKIFSENAYKTYTNFKNAKGFKVSNKPEPGNIVFWQSYKNNEPVKNGSWFTGHVGIVTGVHQLYFDTVEGNTNAAGSREGQGVYEKKREYDFYKNTGLRLLGFVKPIEV